MKLYQKLQENDLVDDYKDFIELVRLRAIRINEILIDDPQHEIEDQDKIKIGHLVID